jgi:hypothetical protein
MSALPQINLPWFISLHACGFAALGLYYLFKSSPTGGPARRASHTPALGIATFAVGVSYLFTAYMPIEENQFLHATVPARLLIAGLLVLRVAMGGLGPDEKRILLSLGLYDGIGAVVLGLSLGRWNGRVPLYSARGA